MTISPRALVIRSLGVAFVLATALAFSPGRAEAACGDYVSILNDQSASHTMPDPMAGHLPKTPCHGPSCSERPSLPAAPVPAPVSAPSDTKACVVLLAGHANDTGERLVPCLTDESPVHLSVSIFHPPRV